MLQILDREKAVICTGMDTSQPMLDEARIKLQQTRVRLLKIEPGEMFPLKNEKFDRVTICNVLFNLSEDLRESILREALRVLKPKGKLLVLTPTGNGSFTYLTKKFFSRKNLSIYLWFSATRDRALSWQSAGYLEKFCRHHHLVYTRQVVFSGLGLLETIQRR